MKSSSPPAQLGFSNSPFGMSSLSNASMAASKPVGAHAKLHKRATSSSSTEPVLNQKPSLDYSSLQSTRSDSPKMMFDDSWDDTIRAPPAAANSAFKVRPYLRKLSVKENNMLDLSVPAAENQGLAGLGILEYGNASRSASDVTFTPMGGRSRHNRSTSNTSQFSNSSHHKPTAPYTHPYRQTPRPYTPPISPSHPASIHNSDLEPEEPADTSPLEDLKAPQPTFDFTQRNPSMSSTPTVPPPVLGGSYGSSSRLASSKSQSQISLSSTMPSRSRGDTLRSIDAASPSSRTSMDKAFGFKRPRDDPMDPETRAASIRAARLAYREKEEAKERKAEKEHLKQQDRENRRRVQQEERQRKKSDPQVRRAKTTPTLNEKSSSEFAGKHYADLRPSHSSTLPNMTGTGRPSSLPRAKPKTSKRGARNGWLGFIAWFRTRLLRLGRKMRLSS